MVGDLICDDNYEELLFGATTYLGAIDYWRELGNWYHIYNEVCDRVAVTVWLFIYLIK